MIYAPGKPALSKGTRDSVEARPCGHVAGAGQPIKIIHSRKQLIVQNLATPCWTAHAYGTGKICPTVESGARGSDGAESLKVLPSGYVEWYGQFVLKMPVNPNQPTNLTRE